MIALFQQRDHSARFGKTDIRLRPGFSVSDKILTGAAGQKNEHAQRLNSIVKQLAEFVDNLVERIQRGQFLDKLLGLFLVRAASAEVNRINAPLKAQPQRHKQHGDKENHKRDQQRVIGRNLIRDQRYPQHQQEITGCQRNQHDNVGDAVADDPIRI